MENCQWCSNKLTKREQEAYNSGEDNWVAWCGLDKFATCSKCMKTMCEICKEPCKNICNKCNKVCHSYLCDTMTSECDHRCACTSKDGLTVAPFEITPSNLTTYTKVRLQDENVKYGLARCEKETKEKTIAKLTNHFEKLKNNKSCKLRLDDDTTIEYIYPEGKTRIDLNKLLNEFFTS
jgi:hypothetical protein